MPMAYNPAERDLSKVLYTVEADGQQWFIPTTGYGDNPNSGTQAQRLAQCVQMVGTQTDGTTPMGEQYIVGS